MTIDLRQHYLDYLATLNDQRFDRLADYVADDLTYNGQPTTLARYRRDRAQEFEIIPDLHFAADLLVVDGDRVAARLDFDCTPARPFLGFDFGGARIRFAEHVFYRFQDNRIAEVTSMLDLGAIRVQAVSSDREHPRV